MSRCCATVVGVIVAASVLLTSAPASAAPGEFASAGEIQVGNTPYDVAVGDFNDDGNPDFAAPNANGSNVSVFLGVGDGTFTEADDSPITTNGSPIGAAAGDLDNDGDDDLVVTEGATDSVRVLRSEGDGTFTVPGPSVATGEDPRRVVIGNFTDDAFRDVAVANANYAEDAGSVTVLLGDGTGALAPAATSPEAAGDDATDLVTGDFDADGKADLAVSNNGGDTVSILLGSNSGDFSPPAAPTFASGGGPDAMVAAGLDATAGTDLAVVNVFGDNITVFLGNNLGAFAPASTSPEPQGDNDLAAADVDGDGDIDLASPEGNDSVAVLLNDGSADFSLSPQGPVSVLGITARIAAADLDDDGDQDLLVAGGNGGYYAVTPLLNNEPDEDSDGFANVGDKCPDLAGSTRGCPSYSRQVTLKYKKRAAAFKGVVTSDEPACVGPGVKVRIRKSAASGAAFIKIAKTRTDERGKYRVDDKVGRGRFTALVASKTDPDVGICGSASSPVFQVKPSNR